MTPCHDELQHQPHTTRHNFVLTGHLSVLITVERGTMQRNRCTLPCSREMLMQWHVRYALRWRTRTPGYHIWDDGEDNVLSKSLSWKPELPGGPRDKLQDDWWHRSSVVLTEDCLRISAGTRHVLSVVNLRQCNYRSFNFTLRMQSCHPQARQTPEETDSNPTKSSLFSCSKH